MACERCNVNRAVIVRPKNRMRVCKECFYILFEDEVHEFITTTGMFPKGTRVGIGVSGGKDSTVLAYVLNRLNKRHGYDIELILLCVDEGIAGYRDPSIATVMENKESLGLPLKVVSFKELFGLDMDEVVSKVGRKGNCTYCGAFRRQALEDAARQAAADCIATGHNADDMAETVLLNLMRGDISRLKRCTLGKTAGHQVSDGNKQLSLPRCKPFKLTYQKEIVFYAYFKKLLYFSVECTYAPGASRGDARSLIKELERIDSGIIHSIIRGAEEFAVDSSSDTAANVVLCNNCAHPTSSQDRICSACRMLKRLSHL